MKRDLKALYQEVILQHSKSPRNYGSDEAASEVLEAYNPLCGDRFKLYLTMEEGRIKKISFDGYGCAISKASTSVLTQRMEGLNLEEAKALCATFNQIVVEGITEGEADLAAFAAAKNFPGRDKCALLSWEELADFLE